MKTRTFFLILLTSSVHISYSQDGALDPTFGTNGIVQTALGSSQSGQALAIQPDGKIILAGSVLIGTSNIAFGLARYNTNGTLDNTFDIDGRVITLIGNEASATAIAIQKDGKIVVAGSSKISGGKFFFTTVRYNTNGKPDSSFNEDGIVTTAIGSVKDVASAIVIQNDGKILVAGTTHNGTDEDFALVRYKENGYPDSSFNGNGIVSTDLSSFSDFARSVIVQPDGKIVVGGTMMNSSSGEFSLARYNTNGSLDNSFSEDGILITSFGEAVEFRTGLVLQADGKIIIAGSKVDGITVNFTLLRFTPGGSTDSSFGANGIVTTAIGSISNATAIDMQPDGKIIVGGYANTGANYDLAVVRYNTNGNPDSSFDNDGIKTTNINGNDFGNAIKVSGSRIYLGGSANFVFAMAAYQTGSIVVPITLTSFSALEIRNKIILHWQTISEQNSSHFEIEKSSDGIQFVKIGSIQALGNTSGKNEYSFGDKELSSIINYYRLKMIDIDGRSTYSNIIIVKISNEIETKIFPNPVRDVLQVQLNNTQPGATLFQVMNTEGKILDQQNYSTSANRLSVEIAVADLLPGMYYLAIKSKAGISVKKFIKH